MAVESGVCVELVFARLWSSSLTTVCSAAIEFRGVRPIPSQITILGGDRVSGVVQLMTQLSTASIAPVAKLGRKLFYSLSVVYEGVF